MSKNVTVNGVDYTGVSQVQLPTTAGGTALFKDVDEITTPSGDINITENGTHDVSAYAQAVVNVESGGSGNTDEYERIARLMTGEYFGVALDNKSFTVPAGTTLIRGYTFYKVRSDSDETINVSLPDTVTEIATDAFYYASSISIGSLPPNLKKLSAAFKYARDIFSGTELEIPASLEELSNLAFYQCSCPAIATITFKGTPTSIAANAMQNSNIKTINVPWAEGAVANAPWGATSATINYNYTGA